MTQQERAQFWHEQIDAWQASGLSGQAFCKQHGLSYHQLVYRRKKQNQTRSDQSARASGFTQVTQVQSSNPVRELTLALPGGVSITGIHAGNIDLLSMILGQL